MRWSPNRFFGAHCRVRTLAERSEGPWTFRVLTLAPGPSNDTFYVQINRCQKAKGDVRDQITRFGDEYFFILGLNMKFCSGIKLFLDDPETEKKFRPYVLNLTRWWLDSNCDQVTFSISKLAHWLFMISDTIGLDRPPITIRSERIFLGHIYSNSAWLGEKVRWYRIDEKLWWCVAKYDNNLWK